MLNGRSCNTTFTPNLSLRAGRMILPVFMYSEYRKVGFALPWVRPPSEFYNVPNQTTDGLGLIYKRDFGELNYTFYGTYSEDDSYFPGQNGGPDTHSKSREAVTLSNTFEYKDTTFRASYARVKITMQDLDDLFAAYKAFGPSGEKIYDEFSIKDREYAQLGLGFWHDPGKWFIGGEWARGFSDTFIQPGDSWYMAGGYRIGKFTPYLTYAQTRRSHGNIPLIDATTAPPFTPVDLFNNILNSTTYPIGIVRPVRQSTITVGTRWDFAESAAFKMQLDHIKTEENSNTLFINPQPNFDYGDSVNILSFSLDFVF